mgnify:FL=1
MRELAREDDGLLRALTAQRDHENAAAEKRRRLAKEANDRSLALRDLKRHTQEAEAALRASKEAAVAAEAASHAKFALAQWETGDFMVKKNRMAALGRPARCKGALSDEQRAEWARFKTHWDETMSNHHGEAWPVTFARWMQAVANDAALGNRAALSQFVYNETARTLGGQMALVIPGRAS